MPEIVIVVVDGVAVAVVWPQINPNGISIANDITSTLIGITKFPSFQTKTISD